MANETGGANGVWKWVSALLAAIMLAGSPGYVQALRTPSESEVSIIRERQTEILIRMSQIDEQIANLQELLRAALQR